jgi:hypothetical protein
MGVDVEVIEASACPSRRATECAATPACSAGVADVCRRPWNLIGRTRAAFVSARNGASLSILIGCPNAAVGVFGKGWLGASIKILSPVDGASVGLKETVHGSLRPPQKRPLQVWVRSNRAGTWHRQRQPHIAARAWSVECQFGDDPGTPGGTYEIVAVLGNPPSDGNPSGNLPSSTVRSNRVRVTRTH